MTNKTKRGKMSPASSLSNEGILNTQESYPSKLNPTLLKIYTDNFPGRFSVTGL